MSIVAAMNRIITCLNRINPEVVSNFAPGLTDSSIHLLTQNIPFYFPQEVQTLYKWRNGISKSLDAIVFPTGEYLPLNEAVEWYQNFIEAFEPDEAVLYQGKPLFPFYEMNGHYCAVILDDEPKESSPVITINDVYETEFEFPSLTEMMLAIAECYETGAYYLNEDGFIDSNDESVALIFRRYNSELVEETLSALTSLLAEPIELLSEESLDNLYNLLGIVRKFHEPRAVELLLAFWIAHPQPLADPIKDFIRADIVNTLGVLKDVRAIEVLIAALKDESKNVRDYAALGLEKLGDARAIEPLFEALEDDNDEVQRTACYALMRLKAVDANSVTQVAEHPNPRVRAMAAIMIEELKVPILFELLPKLQSDNDFEVRRSAYLAISYLQREGLIE